MLTERVEFSDVAQMISVFGTHDVNIKNIESRLSVSISARNGGIEVSGEDSRVRKAVEAIEALKRMIDSGCEADDTLVDHAMDIAEDGQVEDSLIAMGDVVAITNRGKPVKCRTLGQKKYIKALEDNTITICIGPAGTGKTYLAVASAVNALRDKRIERIVMSRPAIEAGEERLGFLPGDLQSKVDPYLRPLYDALYDMLGHEQVEKYRENGTIEIAPLAYMRGRTLNSCCLIIDESQNASFSTLKLALTRLGEGSKMILTGDITQIDLPMKDKSGLEKCAEILKNIDDIGVVYLSNKDVVRHKLVKDIVKAFEREEEKQLQRSAEQKKYYRKTDSPAHGRR